MNSSQDAQLFRSEFLNNHPILLEYIVEGATGSRPSSARQGSARGQAVPYGPPGRLLLALIVASSPLSILVSSVLPQRRRLVEPCRPLPEGLGPLVRSRGNGREQNNKRQCIGATAKGEGQDQVRGRPPPLSPPRHMGGALCRLGE